MGLAAILVAVMLKGLSPVGMVVNDAACLGFACSMTQEAAQDQNPQNPSADPTASKAADTKEADTKETDSKIEDTTAKKTEEPKPEKPRPAKHNTVRKRRSSTHKSIAPSADDAEPRKVVVHQGSVSEPIAQLLPGITEEEASHQRESAEQLLATAESHLKELAVRTLNLNQQELIVQIRQYMDGARSALKESDFQRAHTLALKAYLLSDDLVKH